MAVVLVLGNQSLLNDPSQIMPLLFEQEANGQELLVLVMKVLGKQQYF